METDRREFFRVTDTAYLSTAPFEPEKPSVPDYFPDLHQIAVVKEFEQVDAQFLEFLDRVKDASVRKLLKLFNDKLDLMSRTLHIRDIQDRNLNAQSIDISEGGCSALLPGEFEVDQELALAIIFTPSYLSLFCRARVADVGREGEQSRLHLEFVGLTESQRQTLTRHMFKVQARNRDK